LPQPASFASLAASVQDGDPTSTLELYRAAVRLRRELLVGRADFELLGSNDEVLAFRRGADFSCTVNMGDEAVPLAPGEVLLASQPVAGGMLPPDTAVWMRR